MKKRRKQINKTKEKRNPAAVQAPASENSYKPPDDLSNEKGCPFEAALLKKIIAKILLDHQFLFGIDTFTCYGYIVNTF